MTQEERYRQLKRRQHKSCADYAACRCHQFHLGKTPKVGDVIAIVDHTGPECSPVCGYAVVTGAASTCSWLEKHHKFEVAVETVVACPWYSPGDQMTLDNDNMEGVWWKALSLLDRLAAI
jgi:hypothetical protein